MPGSTPCVTLIYRTYWISLDTRHPDPDPDADVHGQTVKRLPG
jgi:hypothetical protein